MIENQGWIKLHRTMMNWEWYTDIPVKTLYIHLLLSANHSEQKWRGITVERGELITSYSHLAEETGLSFKQVRTAIKKLTQTGEISVTGASQFSRIKCLNYCVYQARDFDEGQAKGTPRASEGQTKGTQGATNKNEKNYKNKKNARIHSNPSFDIEEIKRKAKFNEDYDV